MARIHRSPLALLALVLPACAVDPCDNGGCGDGAPDSGAANGSEDPANTASAGNTGGAVNTGDSSNTPTTPGPAGFGGDGVVGGTAGTQSESGGGGAGAGTNADGGGQGGSNTLGGAGNSLGGADGGGTTGEGGNAGGTIVIPIGPMCTGNANCLAPTPVCDTALERCVVCLTEDNSGCAAEAPHCVGDGNAESRCVACLTNDECPVETPLCDADGSCTGCAEEADCSAFAETLLCRDDGQCVACLSESDCPTTAPVCDDTGTCSGCGADPDCEHLAETPICDELSGACVGCTENTECATTSASLCENQQCVGCTAPDDCSHLDGTPTCNTDTAECVECVLNTDCPLGTASACIDNICVPCTEDAQCEHLTGTTVCDTEASECVECTGLNDDACAVETSPGVLTEYVCDSLNRTCAPPTDDNEVASSGSCQPCLSDAHCNTGRVCVQTEYEDEVVPGWYCMWERGAVGAPASCNVTGRPYFSSVPGVTSIDGRADLTVCGLRVSTCAALTDFSSQSCEPSGDVVSQCGEPGLDDALCRATNEGTDLCTMRCLSNDDCIDGSTCELGENPRFCSFD